MTVLVSDSFNRANNSTSLGSTDSYNGGTTQTWSIIQGGTGATAGISSNQAYFSNLGSVTNYLFAVVPAGTQNYQVQVQVPTLTSLSYLAFRVQDTSNFFMVRNYSGNYELYKRVSGTFTKLGSVAGGANGDTIKVSSDSSGNITVYINGVSKITATDTSLITVTNCGFGNYQSPTGYFDNFEIDDLSTTTNVPLSSTAKSTSSATATPTLTGSGNTPVALSSTVKSSSSVTSIIKNTVSIISSIKSNTSATATVKTSIALVATVKSNSSVTSNVVNHPALSSTVKSNSSTSNTITDAVSLKATNKSNTSATANISSQAQGALSSVVKSNTSSNAVLGVIKPLSSTVKSSSASSGTVTNTKPISSATKSNSSSSANVTVGFIYISSTTKSRTNSTASAKSSLSLISNVKSKSTAWAVISYPNAPVIISTALLKGSRILNIELQGNQVLDINLKGAV